MPKLPIPDEVWDQHVAILAKTGAGKSFLVQLVTEGQLAAGKRVCIVDPTDRYWGLRMLPNGKPSPYDITIVGGERGDIALRPDHGKALAEIVGKSATNMIISTRKLSKDGRAQFAADFFEHLLAVNQGILHLTIDECHLFAPQQGLKAGGFTPRMLSATNEIASSGRGVGLCMNFVSQRAAKLHNDVLACAETLIAMKMKLPHDVDAVRNWIKEWASLEQGKEVVASLSRLKTGEAWVWASDHDMLERIKVPHVATYDSGAPGAAQKAPDLKPMDMDTITSKLAAAGEKILADDPRALKAEIAKLKREAGQQGASEAELAAARNEGYSDGHQDGYRAGYEAYQQEAKVLVKAAERSLEEALGSSFTAIMEGLQKAHTPPRMSVSSPSNEAAKMDTPRHLPPVPVRNARPDPLPKPAPNYARGDAPGDGQAMPKMDRTILSVLAQYPQGLSTRQIEIHTTHTLSGGSGASALARMRAAAWIETGPDRINRITDLGLDALGPYDPLPRGPALRQHWLGKLGKMEATLLSAVCDVYPGGLTTAELAEVTGHVLSGGSGASALAKLRGLGLVAGKPIVASEELF